MDSSNKFGLSISDCRGLLWQSLLSQFPSDFVLPKCLELALYITTTPTTGLIQHDAFLVKIQSFLHKLIIYLGVSSQQLMVLMGQVLSRNLTSSSESQPGKMLNVIWPYLSRKEDVESYLQCIDAWMPYLLRHWRVSFVLPEIKNEWKIKAFFALRMTDPT